MRKALLGNYREGVVIAVAFVGLIVDVIENGIGRRSIGGGETNGVGVNLIEVFNDS